MKSPFKVKLEATACKHFEWADDFLTTTDSLELGTKWIMGPFGFGLGLMERSQPLDCNDMIDPTVKVGVLVALMIMKKVEEIGEASKQRRG